MEGSPGPNRHVRFGAFELDLRTHELQRNGRRLKLRGHPVRVLEMLLENPGDLVTREAIRQRLWPSDTFVDFEHNLNNTVNRLREELGDRAEKPIFIETLPRQGYRFIAPVELPQNGSVRISPAPNGAGLDAGPAGQPSPLPAPVPAARGRLRIWPLTAAVALVLGLSISAWWFWGRGAPGLRIASYIQLTSDGRMKTIEGTDGNNIYLNLWGPAGHAIVPITGGRLREIPIDLPTTTGSSGDNPVLLGVSPDGSALLVGSDPEPGAGRKLWVIGTHGSSARYLAKDCRRAAWSPDGKTVLYSTRAGDIYTVPSEGGVSRLLLAFSAQGGSSGLVFDLAWSPDGRKIRFVRNGRYWEVSPEGTNAHELLPRWRAANPKYNMWSGHWTPDGDFFLFAAASSRYSQDLSARSQIWALDERDNWLHRPNPEPIQLTTGATYWGGMDDANIASEGNLAISRDGTRVYSTGSTVRGELVTHNAGTRQLVPYLGGISADFVDFSRDGKLIVYVSYPEGIMWRASRDGTGLVELNTLPLYPVNPRWSPDGSQILFFAASASGSGAIYTMPSRGGTPKQLPIPGADEVGDPGWSPDGQKIVFSQRSGRGLPRTCILEVSTGRIIDLPAGPRNAFSPRWSPDGRYIVETTGGDDLALFEMQRNRWSVLHTGRGRFNPNWPAWSHDSRFIYFLNIDVASFKTDEPGVYRIEVTGGEPEKVVDLKGFSSAGYFGFWSGLDPDDNPILLRYAGMREIFALTLVRD